ncbi:hypothetical protein QM716_29200, partial [Rhodococcus sp. IEGM 1409]|uniref:hypothetical protein n=1 Tax=Rhodococcus sp. IEGM 1409 TaxID=3047082 RepID=UPI0024B682D4
TARTPVLNDYGFAGGTPVLRPPTHATDVIGALARPRPIADPPATDAHARSRRPRYRSRPATAPGRADWEPPPYGTC